MKIKTLLISALTTTVIQTSAIAQKPGPYLGAQLGLSKTASKGELSVKGSYLTFPAKTNSKQSLSADLIAGYLFPASSFLVGGEVSIGLDTTKPQKRVTSDQTVLADATLILKRKMTSTFNAILARRVHTRATMYAKAGFGISRFKTQLGDAHRPKKSTTRPSLTCALGVETPLTKNISARAEVSYERFKTVNATPIEYRINRTKSINVRHKNIHITALKVGAVVRI